MNVTEAVDSLSAMFHPSAPTRAASLNCHLPSYHVEEFISAFSPHPVWKQNYLKLLSLSSASLLGEI